MLHKTSASPRALRFLCFEVKVCCASFIPYLFRVEYEVFVILEQTTMIPWDPTGFDDSETKDDSRGSSAVLSFLLDTSSKDLSNSYQGRETQAIESQFVESQSLGNNSDASSIGRFPSFHFNLHSLTSLSQLAGPAGKSFKGSRKVNVLLAVLEVEGPDVIRIKKGADAGKQVGIFKMILGDEEGNVCKLTAWREVAEEWGGVGESVATKRGDIVHIESNSLLRPIYVFDFTDFPSRRHGHLRSCCIDDDDGVSLPQIPAGHMLSYHALCP